MGLKKWIVMPGIVSSLQVNLVKLDLEFARIQTEAQEECTCVPILKWVLSKDIR